MKTWPVLYKMDSKGKIRQWKIAVAKDVLMNQGGPGKVDDSISIVTGATYYVHHGEGEVVFINELPLSQIKGVAWAKDWDEMATDFYPIDQWMNLVIELANKEI